MVATHPAQTRYTQHSRRNETQSKNDAGDGNDDDDVGCYYSQKESHWTANPPTSFIVPLATRDGNYMERETTATAPRPWHAAECSYHDNIVYGDIPKDSRQQYLLVCNIDG